MTRSRQRRRISRHASSGERAPRHHDRNRNDAACLCCRGCAAATFSWPEIDASVAPRSRLATTAIAIAAVNLLPDSSPAAMAAFGAHGRNDGVPLRRETRVCGDVSSALYASARALLTLRAAAEHDDSWNSHRALPYLGMLYCGNGSSVIAA